MDDKTRNQMKYLYDSLIQQNRHIYELGQVLDKYDLDYPGNDFPSGYDNRVLKKIKEHANL